MSKARSKSRRLLILPYALAMQAYAYARKSFSYAMEQMGYFYLEVPRQDVDSHDLYWTTMEGMYNRFRNEARTLSPKYEFSKGQIKALGLVQRRLSHESTDTHKPERVWRTGL